MKTKLFIAVFFFVAIAFMACNKENSQTSSLKIQMTDAPAAWDEVNIDLMGVEVKFSKDTTKWMTLQANAGVYNLLGLQNGIDTLIAQGTFPTNSIVKEIRLILGTNNTIKVNGQIFPLTIPSGGETGLKIKVNKKLQATIETILIDFDAALSIKEEVGGYKLKPVIKLK